MIQLPQESAKALLPLTVAIGGLIEIASKLAIDGYVAAKCYRQAGVVTSLSQLSDVLAECDSLAKAAVTFGWRIAPGEEVTGQPKH